MEDYEIIKRLGGGSFADVYQAKEKSTGDLVAIKVLKKKYKKFEDCCELREIKSLQKLQQDSLTNEKGVDNIIKLKQIIFDKKTGVLNIVFEYMETDLYELMKKRSPQKLSETEIRDITYQILLGLYHMHKYGFFHRDMKPENLLLTGKKIKIADFGLAREIRSIPPYTEYVSTRYYRAPECILRSTNYNSPIDIWALGCIIAEMYMHPMPLFYGSTEKEVFYKICSILGSPNNSIWPDGINQAKLIGMKIPPNNGTDLKKIVIGASDEAIDLMEKMLKWDPNSRETANNLLDHPFFKGCRQENKLINSNIFNDLGDVKSFNKTKRRFRQNNDENNKDNEDDNFNKLLNDTKGFNKFLNQLKIEEKEDNKTYEKNKNINFLQESFYKHLNINESTNKISNKKVINEVNENENENDSDSEDNKKPVEKGSDLDFLLNSNNFYKNDDAVNKNRNRNKKESTNTESKYDYLYKENNNNNISSKKGDIFDDLIQKDIEKDSSNIDSELNKLLNKDNEFNTKGLSPLYNDRSKYTNDSTKCSMSRARSQINTKYIKDKSNEYNEQNAYNLKPIIKTNRRAGRGSVDYEPNKDSIFNNLDIDNKNVNLNIYDKYNYNRNLQPFEYKDKTNLDGYNNNDNFGEYINKANSFINPKKFNSNDNNNYLFSPFQKKAEEQMKLKRNYMNQYDNYNWNL